MLLTPAKLWVQDTAYAPDYAAPGSATSQKGCVDIIISLPPLNAKSETLCGSTDNIDRLADTSADSFDFYASLTPPVLPAGNLGGAPKTSIKVRMSRLVKAGMVVGGTGSLADAAVAGGAELVTYSGGVQKQVISLGSLVGSNALSSVPMRLYFVANRDFDNLEIWVGGTLNAHTLRAYYVYAFPGNGTVPYQGVVSSLPSPLPADAYDTSAHDQDGLMVCANNSVQNPQNAVSGSLTDYVMADVSCPSALNVKLTSPAAKNFQAEFVVGSNTLPDVNVLRNFKVVTFLNGKPQETSAAVPLLEAVLLPDGKAQISFPAALPFDHLEPR